MCVRMDCVKGGVCKFLVDSGAAVSVIKIGVMVAGISVDTNNTLKLAGVTSGKARTIGSIRVALRINEEKLEHTFHLVQDDFGVEHMGILGRDFLSGRRVSIDFENDKMRLKTYGGVWDVKFSEKMGCKVSRIKNVKHERECEEVGFQRIRDEVHKVFEGLNEIKNLTLSHNDRLSNIEKGLRAGGICKKKVEHVDEGVDSEVHTKGKNTNQSSVVESKVQNLNENIEEFVEEIVSTEFVDVDLNIESEIVYENSSNEVRENVEIESINKGVEVNVKVNEQTENIKVEVCGDYVFLTIGWGEVRIPVFSERFLKFNFELSGEYVCEEQELSYGIVVGSGLIVRDVDGLAEICVTNFRDKECVLDKFRLMLKKISEYDVLSFKYETKSPNRIDALLAEIDLSHLTGQEAAELKDLCKENSDVFFLKGDRLGCTNAVEHEIPIVDSRPVYVRQYRLPQVQKQIMNEKISEMLDSGIIRSSYSPYNFPTILVAKKSESGEKKWRLVVDYRKLNDISIADSFPLPLISDILDQLGGASYFSTLDLASGYHQLLVKEEDRSKTAFSTDSGHYEYVRLPMGLMNSGRTFQRLMNRVLEGLSGKDCFVYLDDIVVYGRTLAEHNERLGRVFSRLRTYELKLQSEKCKILRAEVVYLGHLITANGIRPDPGKTDCVKNFPVPKTIRHIKSFLGLVGYYRRFVEGFAEIAKPLTKQLRKGMRFGWNSESQVAFELFKQILINPPILQYPDFTKEFVLTTDASTFALGAVLSQGPIGSDLPIAYASRTMIGAETRYATTDQEMLGIIWGVKHFRPYLWGRKFKIVTDHQPLTWIFNVKDPSSRLIRWRIQLAEYDYEIVHKKGKLNKNADALSRIEPEIRGMAAVTRAMDRAGAEGEIVKTSEVVSETGNEVTEPAEGGISDVGLDLRINKGCVKTQISEHIFEVKGYEDKDIVSSQIKLVEPGANVITGTDEWNEDECVMGNVVRKMGRKGSMFYLIVKNDITLDIDMNDLLVAITVLREMLIELNIKEIGLIKNEGEFENLKYESVKRAIDSCLDGSEIMMMFYMREKRVLTQENEINQIIETMHSAKIGGHVGINRLERKLRQNFDFPNIRDRVKHVVDKCELCKKNKYLRRTKMPMEVTTTAKKPFERIALDIVGPLPETMSGNKYLLTFQDDLTKYVEAMPLANQEADTVARAFVKHIILRHSSPESILTDNGTNFVSELFRNVCKLLGAKRQLATPYHPETNGALERTHRTFKEFLRNYVNDDLNNWDDLIQYGVYVFNTTPHTATKYSPYELLYGFKPQLPCVLKNKPQVVYNYDNYLFEIRYKMQRAHELAREHQIRAKEKSKENFDKKAEAIQFKMGQLVLMENVSSMGMGRKLKSLFVGPYEVVGIPSRTNTTIMIKGKPRTYHNNLLKMA